MAEVDVQRILATINQCFAFQIPPQTSAGYRADSWPSTPAWTGRLVVSSVGDDALIELKDPNTGALFAACPIQIGGPPAVQKVVDSSRYFVLRAVDRASGRHAFIGIAFNNRSDAFDFNVAVDDLSKELKREKQQQSTPKGPAAAPKNYSLKEGETMRIKINSTRNSKDTAPPRENDPFGWDSVPASGSGANATGFSDFS